MQCSGVSCDEHLAAAKETKDSDTTKRSNIVKGSRMMRGSYRTDKKLVAY